MVKVFDKELSPWSSRDWFVQMMLMVVVNCLYSKLSHSPNLGGKTADLATMVTASGLLKLEKQSAHERASNNR